MLNLRFAVDTLTVALISEKRLTAVRLNGISKKRHKFILLVDAWGVFYILDFFTQLSSR